MGRDAMKWHDRSDSAIVDFPLAENSPGLNGDHIVSPPCRAVLRIVIQ